MGRGKREEIEFMHSAFLSDRSALGCYTVDASHSASPNLKCSDMAWHFAEA